MSQMAITLVQENHNYTRNQCYNYDTGQNNEFDRKNGNYRGRNNRYI